MINWALETHDTLSSTQDAAKKAAAKNAHEGFAVQALRQTEGQGRHGREWISKKGNLYLSFLLRPDCEIRYAGQIALLAGVAVARTVGVYLSVFETLRLKWPNDILIDNKKIAGILLETGLKNNKSLAWMALGIGINVALAPLEHSICLQDCSGRQIPVNEVRDLLLQHFAILYEAWQQYGFQTIRQEWLYLAHAPGEIVQVRFGHRVQRGFFYDIDELGNMLLKTSGDEIMTITAGDVYV